MSTEIQKKKAFMISESQRDALLAYLQKRPYEDVASGIDFLQNAPSALLKVKDNQDGAADAEQGGNQAESQSTEYTVVDSTEAPATEDQGDDRSGSTEVKEQKVFFILEVQRNSLIGYLQERPYKEVARGIEFLTNAPTALLQVQNQAAPEGQQIGNQELIEAV